MSGGLVDEVPTTKEECVKLGKDLINKKGGPMLAKLTGASHNNIGHNYVGRNYIGYSHLGHNYMSQN